MHIINPDVEYLVNYVENQMRQMSRKQVAAELASVQESMSDEQWITDMEEGDLIEGFTAMSEPAILENHMVVSHFEMLVSVRFTLGEHIYLSDGHYAYSPRRFNEDFHEAVLVALGNIGHPIPSDFFIAHRSTTAITEHNDYHNPVERRGFTLDASSSQSTVASTAGKSARDYAADFHINRGLSDQNTDASSSAPVDADAPIGGKRNRPSWWMS
jgi:hypothetical protein